MRSLNELHHLSRLLDRHGLSVSGWVEMDQCGFSGARIYQQASSDDSSYVLKVTAMHTDWIMRATADSQCREAVLAETVRIGDDRVDSPAVGSAQDGATFSILMHDIGEYLLPNRPLTLPSFTTLMSGITHLHTQPTPDALAVPWCSIADRLTLFKPDSEKLAGFAIADDILRGWELFFSHAPAEVGSLVRSLFEDMSPMESALAHLPSSFLHGDLKLDNIAIRRAGALSLIDWSMTMIAPAAIDLGWFLAMNSRTLPIPLEDALSAYTSDATIDVSLHERHEALTVLCGLLIRGWRKGLDAEAGDLSELTWWCAGASRALPLLSISDH